MGQTMGRKLISVTFGPSFKQEFRTMWDSQSRVAAALQCGAPTPLQCLVTDR